ncbi:MAG TPA: NAD(P)H-hydrate dehydratase [Methylomirabilota bacterium]|nr:NAD(P)H-hydrate dehydratase [Methylomirabilota bacterium]
MLPVFTAEEMRRVDERAIRDLQIPGATLMENAGRGAAEAVLAWLTATTRSARGRRVVVMCGKGGNGGDGFVVARHLKRRGVRCDVLLLAPASEIGGDAATKLRELQKAGVRPVSISDAAALAPRLARADLIVDALLGTGGRGGAEGLVAASIDAVNAAQRPVISLDIPSGVPADGGEPPRAAIRADATVTFAGLKRGLVLPPGRAHAGRVSVIDIGVPAAEVARGITTFVVEQEDVTRHFPRRRRDAHKGTYGHLLVVAGSVGKTGAAALAADAALRAGVGLVTVATAASQQPILAGLVVEAMTAPLSDGATGSIGREAWTALTELVAARDAVAVGPGLGLDAETHEIARRLVSETPAPMVVDADALTALVGHLDLLRKAPAPRCLTPHPGELARMLGVTTADIQRDRIGVARDFATTYRVHLVLKGAVSVVATAEGLVILNPTGNPGMASGGTGDVLTGMVGAFLARGLAPDDAVVSAVYLHGLAGDIAAERMGEESLIARDVIAALPDAFARVARPCK